MAYRTRGRWLTTIGVLFLAGCHSYPYAPYYYQPGPYGPTMSQPPGGYITPGPTYTPQMSPTPISPGTSGSPTPISPSQQTPTWRPESNNGLQDAPPYKPNPGGGSTGGGLVPDPLDADFGAPPPAAAVPRPVPLSSAPPFRPAQVTNASAQQPMGDDTAFFEEPRRVTAMPTEVDPFDFPAATPAATQTNKQSTPYGHDAQQYTWLRGLVDFDETSKTWSIIYNLTPEVNDKFGGSFVFAPHDALKGLKPGMWVLAKGRVDPGHTDHTGKALYEAAQIVPLPPPADVQ